MVLSIIIAAMVAPGLLGSQEAIRQGQAKDRREEHRARRCNLIATCITPSKRSREIDGRPVVLSNGKLWIDCGTAAATAAPAPPPSASDSDDTSSNPLAGAHRYAGYYLPYPDSSYEGLVTTITDVAPIMNWVYVDRSTHEVRYGVRADAQPNFTGPFDCTRQDRRMTFDGWEGWCAVEEVPGLWALYFDVDDDGLRSKVAPGTRVLELELARKEKKFKKDKEARQQDQTTTREVDSKQDVPVDRPVAVDPQVTRPGVFGFADGDGAAAGTQEAPKLPKTPPPAYYKDEAPQHATQVEVTPYEVRDEAQRVVAAPEKPQQVTVDAQEPQIAVAQGPQITAAPEPQQATAAPLLQNIPDPAQIEGYFAPKSEGTNVASPQPLSLETLTLSSEEQDAFDFSSSMGPPNRPLRSSLSSQSMRSSPTRSQLPTTPITQTATGSPSSTRPRLKSTSTSDLRSTTRINRKSSNREMSQAQMFNALDAAKKASEDMLAMVRNRSSRADNHSRANSEVDSVSIYYDDGNNRKTIKEGAGTGQPTSSASQLRPGNRALDETPLRADPHGEISVDQEEAEVEADTYRGETQTQLPEETSSGLNQDRNQSPSPTDPAVFGGTRSGSTISRSSVKSRPEKKQAPTSASASVSRTLRRTKTSPALARKRTSSSSLSGSASSQRPTAVVATPPLLRGLDRSSSSANSSYLQTPARIGGTRASLVSTMSSTAAGKQPVPYRTQSTSTRLPTRSTDLRRVAGSSDSVAGATGGSTGSPRARGGVGAGAGAGAGAGTGTGVQHQRKTTTSTLLRSLDDLTEQEKDEGLLSVSVPAPLNVWRKTTTANSVRVGGVGLLGRGNPRAAGAASGSAGGDADSRKKQFGRDN